MEPVNFALWIDPDADIPEETLELLLDKLAHRQPVLDMAADIMSRYEKQNFADEGQTFGAPWEANTPLTQRQKAREGFSDHTLVRTGNLENQIGQAITFTDSSASVGIDLDQVPYAAEHQPSALGGLNSGGGRTPPRVLVSVSSDEIEELQAEIQEFYDDIPGLPPGAIRVILL